MRNSYFMKQTLGLQILLIHVMLVKFQTDWRFAAALLLNMKFYEDFK